MSRDSRAFEIVAEPLIRDEQLSALLDVVYVEGGYTPAAVAETLFAPARVRSRGPILAAVDADSGALLGVIVVVAPGSDARQIARGGEAEFHLLAVDPEARGRGIGAALVRAAIKFARSLGYAQIILSTQQEMAAAHRIYEKAGFKRISERDWVRGDTRFMVFEY